MLPLINNKSIMECGLSDFDELLNNSQYCENQFLDYKESFAFLEIPRERNQEREKALSGFRDDICSFANADGGYIIFGIDEDNGVPNKLVGVEVENPDHFELDLRNKLTPILPKVPPIAFRFVRLNNGRYLIIIRVEHDFYSPYTHMVDGKKYVFYKRDGNRNTPIRYTELRNMFIQSNVLEMEIDTFRRKRIDDYRKAGNGFHRFMIFHIIPESFLVERKPLFVLERQSGQSYKAVFAGAGIDSFSTPCVDGLRYMNRYGNERAILYNNGIAELALPLDPFYILLQEGRYLESEKVWGYIDQVAQGYQANMPELFGNQRYYGCISIIGCKHVITERNDYAGSVTKLDRGEVICHPVGFMNIVDADSFYKDLKKLHLEYYLSLGIRKDEKVKRLIEVFINND